MANQHTSFLKKWGSLMVMTLALAIIVIDNTLLNVSLTTIIRDLKTDITSLQWVITLYALILAAFTITGGRIGDLFGRKKMFMLGAVIFAVGSFVASLSHHVGTLLVGEAIIEGIGAALMIPATASLIVANFHGKDRATAFGIWGAVAAASAALGPLLGGYLTTHFSWRWGFRINIFVAAILLIGSILVKESRDTQEKPRLDFIGAILSGIGLLAVAFGFIESEIYGWIRAKEIFVVAGHAINFGNLSITLPSIFIGLIFLVAFVFWELYTEKRGNTPLVSMKLFYNRQFTSGIVTTLILSLGQFGLFFIFPIFYQAVRGLDAFHTGLALLPMPITIFATAPLVGSVLSKKITPKRLIQIGFLLNMAAAVILIKTMAVSATPWRLAWGFGIYGIGMGFIMPVISNLTMSAVPVEQAGESSGLNNTSRQIGATLGSALIGAILITSLATHLTSGINNSPKIPDNLKPTLSAAVAKQTSNVEFGGGAMLQRDLPPGIMQEVQSIGHQATVDAIKAALEYALLFIILGFGSTFFLPKTMMEHQGAQASAAAH